jgi:ParB family chromosome partitioning protein
MSTDQQRQLEANFAAALEAPPANTTTQPHPAPSAKYHGRTRDLNTFFWAVERIRRDPNQVRRQEKSRSDPAIQELAESMAEVGQLYPISIRWIDADGIWEVVDGDCRFVAATEILRWTSIRVTTTDIDDERVIWRQLHENIHRSNLHPLDLAAALKQLRDQGLTVAEIAKRLKKNKTYVQKALSVADGLTAAASEELHRSPKGRSLDTVYEVAKLPEEAQEDFAREIADKGLSRHQVREAVAQARKHASTSPRTKRDRKPHFREIVETPHATVTVTFKKPTAKRAEVVNALKDALRQITIAEKKAA